MIVRSSASNYTKEEITFFNKLPKDIWIRQVAPFLLNGDRLKLFTINRSFKEVVLPAYKNQALIDELEKRLKEVRPRSW
jgi:hypothetical protein